MTVNTETNRVTKPGNGSTTVFDFSLRVPTSTDLKVAHIDANGVSTAWTLGTQYTVAFTYDVNQPTQITGGFVTVKTSPTDYTPATGESITIYVEPDATQPNNILTKGALDTDVIEALFDKAFVFLQLLEERLNRSLRFPIGDESAALLPAKGSRASKFLQFDANGVPAAVSALSVGELTVSAFVEDLLSLYDAAAFRDSIGAYAPRELFAVTTGDADDYVLTLGAYDDGLAEGDLIVAEPHVTNNNDAQINVDGNGAADIRKFGGNELLNAGDFSQGRRYPMSWDASSGYWKLLNPVGATEIDNVPRALHSRLKITRPSASTIDIDAKDLLLHRTSGHKNILRADDTVNETVDITAAGADGLDTGSEANSTWYAIWVIYNPTTHDTRGLLSASFTSPTLPSGFTYRALVGAVYNDSSGNFVNFVQWNNRVLIDQQSVFSGQTNTSGVLTSVDLSAYVPPIAMAITAWLMNDTTGSARGAVQADSGTLGAPPVGTGNSAVEIPQDSAKAFPLVLAAPQTCYWISENGTGWELAITGYDLWL